jgi:hypothetical protein
MGEAQKDIDPNGYLNSMTMKLSLSKLKINNDRLLSRDRFRNVFDMKAVALTASNFGHRAPPYYALDTLVARMN